MTSFSLSAKENEASAFAKAMARQERKAALNLAFGSPREAAACGGAANSPDFVGLRQCGPFIRMQPLREAALNGRKPGKVLPGLIQSWALWTLYFLTVGRKGTL